MLKKIITSAIATSMALAIVGCGGGDSTSPVTSTTTATTEDTTNTGTSQYLDSAVSGITYQCGDQNGITDTNGTFTFEFGQDCTFSLGTIPLRGVSAEFLIDGVPLVEDNITVARVLQSLDFDGDPTNGITIRPEVITVCEEVLSQSGTTELPTTDALLEVLITEVQNNVTEFEGDVVTEEEAQAHLEETLTEVTKTLLAGKTFYQVDVESGNDLRLLQITFNPEVTEVTITDLNSNNVFTESISIQGDKLLGDNEGVVTVKNDYISILWIDTGIENDEIRLYPTKEAAEAYLASLQSSSTTGDLNTLIVGKTVYQNCTNGIESLYFDPNGTLIFNSDANDTISYRIDGTTVITIEDGEDEVHTLQTYSDESITFRETDGEFTTFYYSEALALNAPVTDCGGGDYTQMIPDIVSGTVTLEDENNTVVTIPSNAWIRITPSRFQIEGDWNGVNCKVDANGQFGSECYIYNDETAMREALNDSNESFQIIIYAETTGDTRWEAEEDAYAGGDFSMGAWQNITLQLWQ